jgi:hypothetical protein
MKFFNEGPLPYPPLNSGIRLKEHHPSFGLNQVVFPSGEIVEIHLHLDSASIQLPAAYCDNVLGLCGAYDPRELNDANFSTTFTSNDAAFSTFESANYVERWGGPWGGQFQRMFIESWKAGAVLPGAIGQRTSSGVGVDLQELFSEEECPSAEPYGGRPVTPFALCPELEAEAKKRCPASLEVHDAVRAVIGIQCASGKAYVVKHTLREQSAFTHQW